MGVGVLAALAVLCNGSGPYIGAPRQIGEAEISVSIIETRFRTPALGEAEVDVGHSPGIITGEAVANTHSYGRVHTSRIAAS